MFLASYSIIPFSLSPTLSALFNTFSLFIHKCTRVASAHNSQQQQQQQQHHRQPIILISVPKRPITYHVSRQKYSFGERRFHRFLRSNEIREIGKNRDTLVQTLASFRRLEHRNESTHIIYILSLSSFKRPFLRGDNDFSLFIQLAHNSVSPSLSLSRTHTFHG